jgi:hypothetical protein
MNNVMVSGGTSATGAHPEEHPHLSESLDVEGILTLLAYEESHGRRTAVVQALNERLAAVQSGSEPSGPLGEHLPRTHPDID